MGKGVLGSATGFSRGVLGKTAGGVGGDARIQASVGAAENVCIIGQEYHLHTDFDLL